MACIVSTFRRSKQTLPSLPPPSYRPSTRFQIPVYYSTRAHLAAAALNSLPLGYQQRCVIRSQRKRVCCRRRRSMSTAATTTTTTTAVAAAANAAHVATGGCVPGTRPAWRPWKRVAVGSASGRVSAHVVVGEWRPFWRLFGVYLLRFYWASVRFNR